MRKMGSVDEAIIAPFESEKIKRIKRGEKILPVTEINQEKLMAFVTLILI